MKFQVGDKVKAFGVKGQVVSVEDCPMYPLLIKFDIGTSAEFTKDGRLEHWHKEQSLELEVDE